MAHEITWTKAKGWEGWLAQCGNISGYISWDETRICWGIMGPGETKKIWTPDAGAIYEKAVNKLESMVAAEVEEMLKQY